MREKHFPFENKLHQKEDLHHLVLFNDDYHTFDEVIEALVYHCGHSEQQAEQCAWITHYRGKCTVKTGDYEQLKSMAIALLEEGLTVEIY